MITPKVVISLFIDSRGIILFEEHIAAVGTTSNNKFSKRKALDEGSLEFIADMNFPFHKV